MPTNRIPRLRYLSIVLLAILSAPGIFAQAKTKPAAKASLKTQIVVAPVVNMYSKPTDQSAVVSQALYGNNVTLITAHGEWSRVQTSDHYKGWVPSHNLRIVLSGAGYATSSPTLQVQSLFANLYHEPDVTRHKPVLTLPFEVRLEVAAEDPKPANVKAAGKTAPKNAKPLKIEKIPEGWQKVRLPDNRTAWIQSSDVVADPQPLSIPESIELAKHFLGLPYLWGGRSSFGFDCSGFTQMLMRSRGINMPRDADQQAAWTGVTAVERQDLQPGDLLFFGSAANKITHTAMYIGDGQFIQATTNGHPVIQISRLDDEPWTHFLVVSRRAK